MLIIFSVQISRINKDDFQKDHRIHYYRLDNPSVFNDFSQPFKPRRSELLYHIIRMYFYYIKIRISFTKHDKVAFYAHCE